MIDARFLQAIQGPGDVRVHGVDLRPDAALEADCLAVLDQEESARADRFKVAQPRRQFVITRGALRLLLADRVGRRPEALAFATGRHGKPFLITDGEPSSIMFNVSHSAQRALVAIGDTPLGIDIECLARGGDLDLIARGVFTAAEQAALGAKVGVGRVALFFRLWTVKEALIKARGCGFAYPPARFEVPEPLRTGAAQASFTFPGEAAPTWRITDLSDGAYAAALAQALAT